MPLLRSLQCNQGGFAFDPESGAAYLLNSTGKLAYDALAKGESVATIAATLARDCRVDATTVERDLRDFLERLASYEIFASTP